MKKFFAVLILMWALPLIAAAQDGDLKIPADVATFVEANTKAIALESADLNGDGTKDYILVLEDTKPAATDEIEEGRRMLLILTRGADNKLILAARNDKDAVYCRTCGGVFGDPFAGLEVGLKTFTVNHYAGSSWRWTADYTFNYSRIDKTWQLVRTEESSFHTSAPDKVKTTVRTPKIFGKVNIADFDSETLSKKATKTAAKK